MPVSLGQSRPTVRKRLAVVAALSVNHSDPREAHCEPMIAVLRDLSVSQLARPRAGYCEKTWLVTLAEGLNVGRQGTHSSTGSQQWGVTIITDLSVGQPRPSEPHTMTTPADSCQNQPFSSCIEP